MTRKRKRPRQLINGINPARYDRSQNKFYAYLIPLAGLMIIPFIFLIGDAFKSLEERFAWPPLLWPTQPTFDNFRQLFAMSGTMHVPATRYLLNTIVYTVVIVLLNLLLSVMAGYVLSKKSFRGKATLFQINTLALMFVAVTLQIPRFFVIRYTGLLDTFLVQILPLLAMPIGLFLVKQFIDQIPDALLDAARMDGANDYQIIWRIVIPIVEPALATIAILSFRLAWSSIESSVFYVNNETLKTFAYFSNALFEDTFGGLAGVSAQAAAGLIVFVPNVILFIIMQSRVMNTMAHSGIK
jgi:ABC-type glycerol-3-phosphate transport system permease component